MEQCHSPSKKVYVTTVVGVTSIQTIRVRDFESGVRLVMATGQLGRHYSSGCFDRVCDRNPDDVEGAWCCTDIGNVEDSSGDDPYLDDVYEDINGMASTLPDFGNTLIGTAFRFKECAIFTKQKEMLYDYLMEFFQSTTWVSQHSAKLVLVDLSVQMSSIQSNHGTDIDFNVTLPQHTMTSFDHFMQRRINRKTNGQFFSDGWHSNKKLGVVSCNVKALNLVTRFELQVDVFSSPVT
uniref:Pectate lyase n=1 Tax=Panagrellus redivivus TaxID=6233 RepID=A0A7E4W776_PANRE